MRKTDLAYLAGCMDSDGYFTIKRSTYRMRVRGDAQNPTFSEACGLRQVVPIVPELLKDAFGGTVYKSEPAGENRKPLFNYRATDKVAATIAETLLPFVRIKKRQCELMLELRESKTTKYQQHAFWFCQNFPNWQKEELINAKEVSAMLGYSCAESVSQALSAGTLVAISGRGNRFPVKLVSILSNAKSNGKYTKPAELINWREELHREIRQCNKLGVSGTSVNHGTGAHTPA